MRAFDSGVWGLVWCVLVACGGSSVSDDDATGGSSSGPSDAGSAAAEAIGGSPVEAAEPSESTGATGATSVDPSSSGGGAATGGVVIIVGDGGLPATGAAGPSGGRGAASSVGGAIAVGGALIIGDAGVVVLSGGSRPLGGSSSAGTTGIDVPEVELPEDCTTLYRTSDRDYCDLELDCSGNYTYVWCDTWQSGYWTCMCDSRGGYQNFELVGFSGGDACVYIASLCAGGGQIEFTGEPECALTYEELGSDWCNIQQECTQSAEIAEGVSVVSREYQDTWCENYDEAWTCSCNTRGTSMSFDFPASAEAAEVCRDALGICAGEAVEVEGPRQCTRSYQSASPEWCDAQLDCTRTASVDDMEIQVHEYMYTSCGLESEEVWSCECGVGTESTSFELSSSDAWSTCEEASATCIETFASGE
jgi:hypothetical protein